MIEPLFKGATRPPTFFGIPLKPFVFCFLPIAILCMLISHLIWLMLIPIYMIMRILLKADDKIFTEIDAMARVWHTNNGKPKSIYNKT
jgi:type IV secretory pathway VirB3-like protein